MNGRISAALIATGAIILFASTADRAGARTGSRVEVKWESSQDNGQQASPPPQNSDDTRRDDSRPDDTRRDDVRRPDDDRTRRDDRRSDVPAEGERVTLPPDTIISVRIADEINSSKNHTGDIFTGIVDPSVMVHDNVVIPRGTEAHVRMADDKKGGHIHGKAEVRLELVGLVVNGRRLGVESDQEVRGQGAAAAKAKAEAKSGEHLGSASSVAGPAGSAAGPVIAVFSAAKVEMKANSRVEFILAEPFTFAKPPLTDAPQQSQ
ncbi:MAG TPA: hypothetical protein VHT31_00570 [Candidatus Acidoferrum sp.]|nr:hypothetical protein [Candidatus Acidoferrum sp.]